MKLEELYLYVNYWFYGCISNSFCAIIQRNTSICIFIRGMSDTSISFLWMGGRMTVEIQNWELHISTDSSGGKHDFYPESEHSLKRSWEQLKYRFGPRFLKFFLISFNDVSVLQKIYWRGTEKKREFYAATGHLYFMFSLEFSSSSFVLRMIIRLPRYEKSSSLIFCSLLLLCRDKKNWERQLGNITMMLIKT